MGDPTDIINYLRSIRLPQRPHPNVLEGLEYERRVKTCEAEITANMLNLLPSTYRADGAFPNYAINIKTMSREIARLRIALDQVVDDKCYAATRSEFVWQIIGYMVFVDGRFPQDLSDLDFRDLLLNIIRIYFQGSTSKSMEDLVNLFFTGPETVQIFELFKEARIPGSGFDIHDTFKWRVDVGHETFPSDLFSLDADLRILIRIAKPAHTLFVIRHVFTDLFGEFLDELTQFDLCDYNYDDFRKYCNGWADEDRLGFKVTQIVADEDHTADFGTAIPTANLIIKTHHGPVVETDGSRTIATFDSDVTVKVNGTPIPNAAIISVRGLIGEIEVDFAFWSPGDTITISYFWAPDPVYQMVLADPDDPNTWGFRLNEWQSSHNGRFLMSSVLSGYVTPQPEQVEWHYKAFERAYTSSLNDPTSLLLNAPLHATTFPPFTRTSQVENVLYNANALPQDTTDAPWLQVGAGGTLGLGAGSLFIDDVAAGGIEGGGDTLYFFRHIDQSFPNVFSYASRVQVQSVGTLHGVFTGAGFMLVDEFKIALIGFLDDGGTRKIGVCLAPGDEELITSWDTVDVDWTVEQTYRFNRLEDGTIEFFLAGDTVASITVPRAALPNLADLDIQTPDKLIGVYFGSLSRKASSSVRWEFVKYLFQPTQFTQSAQQILALYEGDTLPQDDLVDAWMLIGSHGHEQLVTIGVSIDALTVHDTSATLDSALVAQSNLAGGEFRTYFHDEPTQDALAWMTVDWKARIEHATEEVTGVGFIADDGTRQVKVSFLKDESFRFLTYNAQTLPEDDPEADTVQAPGWLYSETGTVTREIVGHRLGLSFTASETYDYTARWTASGAVVGVYNDGPFVTAGNDWQAEFRLKVDAFTESVDGDGPFSVYVNEAEDVASRNLRLALRTNPGTGVREVVLRTFDSGLPDFVDVALASFDWLDGAYHDYRIVRNTTDANPANHTVLVFVDGTLLITSSYTSFKLSDSSSGVLNQLIFRPEGTPVAVDCELEYINLHNFDSDASSTMYVGVELRQTLPTPFYGFQQVITAFERVAVDWTTFHEYRLIKDPTGFIQLSIDGVLSLTIEYKNAFIPVAPGLFDETVVSKFVSWGSFNSDGLSRSTWDFFRYRIFDGSEGIIAPHHQFLNQHNVISSHEHNTTILPHTDADQPFSSMGVPSDTFIQSDGLVAYTVLNEDTPPVPMTQEVELVTTLEPAHSINNPPDDILNDNPDFLLNDGTQIIVTDDSGQGGWNHWGDKSGLYSCAEFFDQHTGEQGLLTVACDVYGLAELIFNYSSACLDLGMDTDPTTEGYTFDGTGGGTFVVNFISDLVVFNHPLTGQAFFTNQSTPDDVPNLLQGEMANVTVEARIKIVSYENPSRRDIGFTFYDGVRQIQLTIGELPTSESVVLISGVDGARYVLWDDWTDGGFHTFKLTKNATLHQIDLEIDGVTYPTAALPYDVAGTVVVTTWEPPYLVWGSGIPKIGPVFATSVVAPSLATMVEFDFIEVCTIVQDEYEFGNDCADGQEKMLVMGGGRPISFTIGGFSTEANVLGGFNTNFRLWGRLGVGRRHAMVLNWSEEDEFDPYVEVAYTPGPDKGSFMVVAFDFDHTEISGLNNYPGFPDPLEPGNVLGPGAGIPDATFWLGPLVTPAFPGVPAFPPAAGTTTLIPLV